MFSMVKKTRKLFLPPDLQLHLFDSMSTPILLYGSEVWGCEDMDLIDHFYLKYKHTTPYVIDYGELGIILLHLKIKLGSLIFGIK